MSSSRDKDISIAEEPEPQYVDSQYELQEDHKVHKDNLWTSYDKQINQAEDRKTEQSTRSDNLSPVFNGEHGDEIPHLSDIDEGLDDSGHTVDVADKTEDTAHHSAHEVPDTDGNEDQQSSNDVHSAPVERAEGHETSHSTEDEKSNPIRVEEREVDSGSETVYHPEVEPHNAPHEQVHDRGEAHQRLAEDSTTREAEQDHSECEASNSTPTESTEKLSEKCMDMAMIPLRSLQPNLVSIFEMLKETGVRKKKPTMPPKLVLPLHPSLTRLDQTYHC
jgi:hypothetical protein